MSSIVQQYCRYTTHIISASIDQGVRIDQAKLMISIAVNVHCSNSILIEIDTPAVIGGAVGGALGLLLLLLAITTSAYIIHKKTKESSGK